MSRTMNPSRPPELELERPVRGVGSQPPPVERALLASVARVIEEVQANGVAIPRDGDRLFAADVRRLRQELAQSAWKQGSLPGESPPRPLHAEHNGWGSPLDGDLELSGEEHKLPRLVLAMDALDFLAGAMGPADILVWKERER